MATGLKLLRLRVVRSWKTILVVSFTATAAASLCERTGAFGIADAERGAYDQGLSTFTRTPKRSPHIVVVGIDDLSFQEIRKNPTYAMNFGSWPYSRNLWARVIEHLSRQGAKAVVFDAVLDERHTDAAGDLAMAQVMAETKLPVFLGFSVNASAHPLPDVDTGKSVKAAVHTTAIRETFDDAPVEEAEASPEDLVKALTFPVRVQDLTLPTLAKETFDEHTQTGGLKMRHPNPPIAPLLTSASGFGLVEQEEDPDGKMRRTRFVYSDGHHTYAMLSVAAAARILGADTVELSPRRLKLGPREVPINAEGDAEINFGGTLKERFQTVSLFYVLEDWASAEQGKGPVLPKDLFRDKVVLVAGLAVGTADVKATPFASNSPGAIKVASELESLLFGEFITQAPYVVSLLLALAVAFMSVAIITVLRSTFLEIGWPLLLFFGFFAVTGILLVTTRVHVLSAMPMMAGELASVAAVAFNHLFANREREQVKDKLSRYMERDLLEQLMEQQDLPKLDGENMEITAFFSDIRGFSTFSETFREDPKTLAKILNRYLTRVSAVLLEHGACLDKYIGDAVVCIFGAPLKQPQHALNACRAALAVQREVARLREEFKAEGLPDVYTRVGINTAVMFVGNIGSEQLFDYTAIGDGMNLAARLEGANKNYGSLIMVGPRTHELVRDHLETRELDRVRVAGKHEAVSVYELLALKGELRREKQDVVRLYEQALTCYRNAQFAQARDLLEQALRIDAEDFPSSKLKERCEEFLASPPPMPFDGVAQLEK